MTTVIERQPTKQAEDETPTLFVVWIDTNCGFDDSDWEMNSPPKPLHYALDEAAETRQAGYPTRILPEGQTPRPDGLFSNPLTD